MPVEGVEHDWDLAININPSPWFCFTHILYYIQPYHKQ